MASSSAPPPPRPRSAGLYPSLWPCDHADTERTQCVSGAGLPAGFDPAKARVDRNPAVYYPVFMYHRDPEELYVYGRGKAVGKPSYVARVNPRTLEVSQRFELPFAIYVGGAVMHANGNVYVVHGCTLYRFLGGDLDKVQSVGLPLTNGLFSCYNGVTVASDGHLLVKGWAIDIRDREVLDAPIRLGVALLALVLITTLPLIYLAPAMAVLPPLLVALALLAVQLKAWRTGFSWRRFMAGNSDGLLISIDPESLEEADRFIPTERLGFARITVTAEPPSSPSEAQPAPAARDQADLVTIPGSTRLHAWRIHRGRLTPLKGFGDKYREPRDGSYAGCGPTIVGPDIYFTDNVAPVGLTTPSYRLFRKDLAGSRPMKQVQISRGTPGFNFWSNASSPANRLLLSWDTLGAWVEARHTPSLELAWLTKGRCSDCVVVVEDRGYVYLAHYDRDMSLKDYLTAFGPRARAADNKKELRVLDLHTGEERFRVPIGTTAPCMSMILPGNNDDVFLGTRDALIRVSAGA